MASSADRHDPLIGQRIGNRYEVLRLIGKGGTGSIYEASNVRLGRSFALKMLKGEAATNPDVIQRFRREAEIVARIKHPNIVEIVDWEELPDGSPCIVMEYLKGEDLASRISRSGALPWPQIAQIADQVLAALTVTHASGVVHRDLKPQNVFLAVDDAGDEQVKLLDFGVSKFRDGTTLVTTDARLVGTPAYMAPEQAQGQAGSVGTHTDLWAMAIMLHEMATGVLAFTGTNVPAMLYAICHMDPVPIVEHRPDAPPAFVQLIADALVRPVEQRLADAAAMRARLRDALSDLPDVQFLRRAKPASGVVRPRSDDALAMTAPAGASIAMTPMPTASAPARGVSWLGFAILGAVVLGAVGIAYAVMQRRDPEPPRVAAVRVPVPTDATAEPDASAIAVDAAAERHVDEPKPKKRKPPPRDANPERIAQNATKALSARSEQLLECFKVHDSVTGETIKARIEIGADGHPKQVSFAPDGVNASPLAKCLRTEILRVQFPSSDDDQTFTIPLGAREK